jgi:hypothetical protein
MIHMQQFHASQINFVNLTPSSQNKHYQQFSVVHGRQMGVVIFSLSSSSLSIKN